VLASSADLVTWDGQGRIRIKDELLAYAELTDQVLMASNFRGFELWNPQRWAAADQVAATEGLVEAAKYVGF
jgi:DNA-binding transcriptional regulator/RsmH inhibitor MraZ